MRSPSIVRLLIGPLLGIMLQVLAAGTAQAVDAAPGHYRMERLAEGVYALIRTSPTGLWFDANSVFIIGDQDVVVVDSGLTLASTRAALAELRKLSHKPVRYLINTHWHDDHIVGNQVYRDAFPGLAIIAQDSAPADMDGVGARNRAGALKGASGLRTQLENLMRDGRNFLGGALSDEERAGYQTTAELLKVYAAEADQVHILKPTLTFRDSLTLYQGSRRIEIRHLGRGHTAADLVVALPDSGIVVAGDLVDWPIPLAGSTSFPADYAASLDRLLALNPTVLVPGHGPVMRDLGYAREVDALMHALASRTAAAVARGESLEQAHRSVDLEDFEQKLAGDSAFKRFLFDNYVKSSGITAAYGEAKDKTAPTSNLGQPKSAMR